MESNKNSLINPKIDTENIKKINNEDSIKKKMEFFVIFLNKILINIGKEEIKDPSEFKDIKKSDILLNANIINDELMENCLRLFSKIQCGYYDKDRSKKFILIFIKKLAVNLKYNIKIFGCNEFNEVNNKKVKKLIRYISITK